MEMEQFDIAEMQNVDFWTNHSVKKCNDAVNCAITDILGFRPDLDREKILTIARDYGDGGVIALLTNLKTMKLHVSSGRPFPWGE
jgi:hypothetical protein